MSASTSEPPRHSEEAVAPESGRGRRPKNLAEGAFWDLATERGWQITKRGWPDYFVQKDGHIIAVEVMPSAGRAPRFDQRQVMAALEAAGIRCFIWSPEGGFRPFKAPASMGGKGGGLASGEKTTTEGDQAVAEQQALQRGSGGDQPFDLDRPHEGPAVERDGNEGTKAKVDRVWAHFVARMKPRSTLAGDDERRIIRAALKVATAEECCRAIDGCASSNFHMGSNDRQKKYNRLSQILRGRRGRETTRERIDFFLDLLDEAAREGQISPSAAPAVVASRKRDVQRGWRFKDDPEALDKARQSEDWLLRHGIEVVRGEDGYPTFRAVRGEEE